MISDISLVYKADETHTLRKFRNTVIDRINEGRTKKGEVSLTDTEEELIEDNINSLLDLKQYTIPTLRILAT